MSADKQPLLSIVIDEETSIPKVIYKGEEVKHKVSLSLEWDTGTDISQDGLTFAIEYAEAGKNYPAINRIERRVKGHA